MRIGRGLSSHTDPLFASNCRRHSHPGPAQCTSHSVRPHTIGDDRCQTVVNRLDIKRARLQQKVKHVGGGTRDVD